MTASARDVGPASRSLAAGWVVALLALVFHLVTYAGYGYFRDELYYLANGRHLGLGYVEHPPLIGFMAFVVEHVLGTSLFAIRLLPAVFHALTILAVAATAREMGGRRTAQALAGLAAFVAPIMIGLFAIFTMNAFDVLCWAVLSWIVARYLRTRDERLWVLFGVVAGIGLENKISVLFAGFGVACGLLVAGPRTAFRRPWIWIGGAIAGVLFAPHVAWQIATGWPTREFIHNATTEKNTPLSPAAFLGAQALNTVSALPVWIAGLVFLLAGRAAKPFRALGWGFVAVVLVMLSTNSKPYYLSPAYTALFAAGGVALERLGGLGGRLARAGVVVFMLVVGVAIAPFAKALMSEDRFVAYAARLGVEAPREERGAVGRLPQQFADMHGWQELAAAVGDVYARLPAEEKAKACVFGQNYGEAGAIDLFGPRYGLPPAISGHNSYFFWGPGSCTGEVLIVIGGSERDLREGFASVHRAATFTCRDCRPFENNLPLWVARGMRAPMKEVWPRVKKFI